MATAFAAQLRAAGDYQSPAVVASKLKDHDVQIAPVGIAPADLANPNFSMQQFVEGSKLASGNTDWAPIYGPDVWNGGIINFRTGVALQPGFIFRNQDIPDTIIRLRLRIITNISATWGFDATIL